MWVASATPVLRWHEAASKLLVCMFIREDALIYHDNFLLKLLYSLKLHFELTKHHFALLDFLKVIGLSTALFWLHLLKRDLALLLYCVERFDGPLDEGLARF